MIYKLRPGCEILIAIDCTLPNLGSLTILELHVYEIIKLLTETFSSMKLGVSEYKIIKEIHERYEWLNVDVISLKNAVNNLVKNKLISVEKCNNISYLRCLMLGKSNNEQIKKGSD